MLDSQLGLCFVVSNV